MELREQIAKYYEYWNGIGSVAFSSGLLSLPSGMEKVSKCDGCTDCNGFLSNGSRCHGSGEIVTDLTVGEAIEILENVANGLNLYIGGTLFDKSGERIRVKK